jgi:hypothetical protein
MPIKKSLPLLLFPIAVLIFSFWLMFHTFSLDSGHQLLISAKAWSDFGSHIPLIRAFSRGANWPPQYPLFPGEPIRYHYLFFSTVGWLERLGLRLDYALNLPSALGLAALVCLIFIFSSRLFKNLAVGFISGLLFLFNSSFSFLDFFATHRLSLHSLSDVIHNSAFPSFGPWSGGQITAFWNLNIYTNQRHLGLSFAILLLLIYFLQLSPKRVYFTGFLLGSLILLNQAAFVIGLIFVGWYFIRCPRLRLPLLISGLGLIPWGLVAVTTLQISHQITFHPGYLVPRPLTLASVATFWLYNLGFNFFLIPVGFILAPKLARTLVLPAISIFLIANIWKFSPDMINNHKFFNFFVIISSMYSANLLVKVSKIKIVGLFLFLTLTFTLILGGVVDLFPVINDRYLNVSDAPANPDVSFFLTLPPKSVILNSFWFYHPASLAGRPIYNGYSYFTWSYGYDQVTREKQAVQIYSSTSKVLACRLLHQAGISHVELNPNPEGFIHPNWQFWRQQFAPAYTNPASGLVIYSVNENCPG